MAQSIKEDIAGFYKEEFGEKCRIIEKLPQSGSYRQYFRLRGEKECIGVFNEDIRENRAFISFTLSFLSKGLNVPRIISVSKNERMYFLEDLGDKTLLDFLKEKPGNDKLETVYRKVIDHLIIFQFEGVKSIDTSLCYPRKEFDAQSIRWDLNYFKYDFLKLLNIPFDEQLLEDDFNALIQELEKIPKNNFLYRDFQSSNIMMKDDELYFIDYQGGRLGAFYYDLASLLYDAKANLNNELRERLSNYYYDRTQTRQSIELKRFKNEFHLFVLIRIMQAMGAYGFRGIYEKRQQFINSLPFAANNLKYVLKKNDLPIHLPELTKVFRHVVSHPLCQIKSPKNDRLKVRLYSFSFRKGIPVDEEGNGGGFVFDCRGLPNPGRFPEYAAVNGQDREVIEFFQDKNEIFHFINHAKSLVDMTIEDYLRRKRSDLLICFGCTGGQHRSVFCAENLYGHLKKFDIDIELKHLEQEGV